MCMYVCECMCMSVCHYVHACGNQRMTCGSWFSPQLYYIVMAHAPILCQKQDSRD